MNEQTVLHRIYRECVDSVNDIWRRVSFWTQAVDVDLRQGETVQYRLDNLDLDSTKSKTLIEEYIEEAAEQHRLLTAQLDRLEDEIAARIPGLGMLTDTYKIIADANPEAVTAYETRLAEAREEIAAMIKPVEDELERLRGLLTGAISSVEGDPLSDDILQRIEALRTKTDNDVADVNTNYIGNGFDPGVKVIGNSLTEAILNQEFNIHSVGAKFWEFYGFLGDEVVSSEDLYELETVDGMNVLDFLSGSYVNIDYNRKLNLCYIRGWVKIPVEDCYHYASSSHTSVFGAKYDIVLGTIGLIDIFPKMNDNSNQINLNTGIRYACIEYSNGFIYKINSYLGQGHPTYINITNYSDDPYSSVYGSWDHCKVIIPFLWDTDAAQTFYDSTSSTFGDEGEGSDTSTPEYVWVYFEDGYFDNAYVEPVLPDLTTKFVGKTKILEKYLDEGNLENQYDDNYIYWIEVIYEGDAVEDFVGDIVISSANSTLKLFNNLSLWGPFSQITASNDSIIANPIQGNKYFYKIKIYARSAINNDLNAGDEVSFNREVTYEHRSNFTEKALVKFQNEYNQITPVNRGEDLSWFSDTDMITINLTPISAENRRINNIPSMVLYYVGDEDTFTFNAGTTITIHYSQSYSSSYTQYRKQITIPVSTNITLYNIISAKKGSTLHPIGLIIPLYNEQGDNEYFEWNYDNRNMFMGSALSFGVTNDNSIQIIVGFNFEQTYQSPASNVGNGLASTNADPLNATVSISGITSNFYKFFNNSILFISK